MEEIIAIVIFLVVIVAIMTEKVHRTAVALAGAVLLMLSHILTVDKAVGYIAVSYTHLGTVKAVQDISFYVEEGGLFAFLGPNGAGKSTCLLYTSINNLTAKNQIDPKHLADNPDDSRIILEHIRCV